VLIKVVANLQKIDKIVPKLPKIYKIPTNSYNRGLMPG